MALLKTISHHGASNGRLERYLLSDEDGNSRCLAVDASATVGNPESFAREFEQVREYYGKTDGITTRHFIISPDPEAHATLDQVRELAYGWCQEHFGDEGQWVIAYHDDNGIVHAHVALNWVRLDGYKWRLEGRDFSEVANDLHARTRELGLKCGLRDVGRKQREEVSRWGKVTGAESRIARRQGWSWKEDIRHAVRQCAPKSRSFVEMRANLERFYGVKVIERRRGGLTFVHPMHHGADNHRYMVKDYKLGRGFCAEGIEGMLGYDLSELMAGGELPEGAFALRVDKAARELGFGRVRRPEPAPRAYMDRLVRKSRRIGLVEVKGMSDALRCMRRAMDEFGGDGDGGIMQARGNLTAKRDALAQECALRDAARSAAADVLAAVGEFNSTLPVYRQWRSCGPITRARFRRSNEDAIEGHEGARDWLAGHGIAAGDGPLDEASAHVRFAGLNSEVAAMQDSLAGMNSLLGELDRSIALMQRHLAPVRMRRTGAVVPRSAEGVSASAPMRTGLGPNAGMRRREGVGPCGLVAAGASERHAAASPPRAVDPSVQGARAICGSAEDMALARRSAGLRHEAEVDARLRRAAPEAGIGHAERGLEADRGAAQKQKPAAAHTVAEVARMARQRASAAAAAQRIARTRQRKG